MGERPSPVRFVLCFGLIAACVPADPPGGPRRRDRATALASERPRARSALPPEAGPAELVVQADPVLTDRYSDDFERADLGEDYAATSAAWQLRAGRLCASGARNHPVWLRRRLPTNARVEFDAISESTDGDIKVELFGDGRSRARSTAYTDATSYLAIFGGWKNQFHVLSRLDEHASNRREIAVSAGSTDVRAQPVERERRYRFKLERLDGETLHWFVDGVAFLRFSDPDPLRGEGHEYFAFNDWETPVCFDNLVIYPLGG